MNATGGQVTYLTCAEKDYEFFYHDVRDGRVANYLAAMAQNIVERYLKHVIDKEFIPISEVEEYEKAQNLRSHNLDKLARCVNDHTTLNFTEEQIVSIDKANGYYFSTRYPGDEYADVRKEDIDKCSEAVETCRDAVLGHFYFKTHESEKIQTQTEIIINEAKNKAKQKHNILK